MPATTSSSHDDDSEFLYHEECPSCGSSDALARYNDGHGYCFSCAYREKGDGEVTETSQTKADPNLIQGEYKPLKARGLTEETCRKFQYLTGRYKGKPVQIASYHDEDGQIIAQKLRTKDKDFPTLGRIKDAGLFGQHLWRSSGKKLIVTEGEIDAMSVSQVQKHKWPVVSIACGAAKPEGMKKVTKYIGKHLEYISGFDEVIFMFDDDEQGRESAKAAASIVPSGKGYIAKIKGYKDANEALMAGDAQAIISAIWDAKPYRPDGLVKIKDIIDDLMKPVEWGLSWPFQALTTATYGIRRREIYMFGAGTGVGKTDVMIQTAAHLITEHKLPVGLFYLEQPPKETIQRLCGKIKGKLFHLPDAGWTTEEWQKAVADLENDDKVHLYNHFGQTDWDTIKSRIRYLATSLDVKDFFVDHLTALATGGDRNEKEELECIMEEMASIAQELDITLYVVSHLTTPEGKPHEEGGRVTIRHFKGSRAIGFWSHFMFGLERNQQADDDEEKRTTIFRILKDRISGRGTGITIPLTYDIETGILSEKPRHAVDEFEDDFNNEEEDDDDIPF